MSQIDLGVRTKVKSLLAGKYSPQNLLNGPSNIINEDLKNLLFNPLFLDIYLEDGKVEAAIDDYLGGKALTIFGPNFQDENDYKFAVSHWMLKSLGVDLGAVTNRGLFELLLSTQYSDKKINYITYDDNNRIIVKKIDPVKNTKVLNELNAIIGKSIKNDTMGVLFENTFLHRMIDLGYDYSQFKKEVSESLAEGLRSGNVGAQVELSEKFLTDGPLKFVKDGDKIKLNKTFPSLSSKNSSQAVEPTIPADKLEKFVESTDWNTRPTILKKGVEPAGGDSTAKYYTDEQIDKFANAIDGKDITTNPFNFYTGEIVEGWGKIFDGDWWDAFANSLEETRDAITGPIVDFFLENNENDPVGNYDVKITREWRGSLLKDFEAEGPLLPLPDVDGTAVATIAGSGLLSWGGAVGLDLLAASKVAAAFEAASIAGGTGVGWQSVAYSELVAAGQISRATQALVSASRFATGLVTAKGVLVVGSLFVFAAYGYAIWNAEETSQSERLNKLVLGKYVEFLQQAIEDLANERRIGQSFRSIASETQFLNQTLSVFAIDKEVERRVRLFNRFSFELNRDENFLDDPDNVKKAIADSIARGFANIDLPEISDFNEEQIQDRQKFYKQCALMMNMAKLAPVYESLVIERQGNSALADGPDKNKPYGGRFWRATSINKEKLINNIFSSEQSQELFEIPTHVMTQLTPKFRLYKVLNDSTGKLKRTEFVFPMHTDLSRKKNFTAKQSLRPETKVEGRVKSFLEAEFDKGDGVGLKSFTLDFNGTNPAEARNDVKGSMTLFFQSFADFIRERADSNGNKFSFVDLIVQPPPDGGDGNVVQGVPKHFKRQYDPSFYRIMVEIGYNVPDKLEGYGSKLTEVQNAIKNMNKSFYLCMIDHNFNIKNDGTVEVNLTYRAYIETALKSLRFDALTTPELAKQREINETKLSQMSSANCTEDQLKDLKVVIAALEEEIVKNSLNSIMKRLHARGKVFTCEIDEDHRRQFLTNGFFRKCDIVSGVKLDQTANANTGDLGVVLNTRLPDASSGFDFNDADKNDTLVQFFFFGDLLHTILDALYIEEGKKLARGLQNTMIVLGSFEFQVFQREQGDGQIDFNISQIPISVEFFSRWFVDNVINQKSTRRSFPILNFIRSLSNALVSNALLESCVNRNIDDRLMFQTGQFSSYSPKGIDIIGSLIHNYQDEEIGNRAILDTDLQRGDKLPLEGSPQGDSKIENFFHYIVLNANGSTRKHDGKGIYKDDINKGVFHVEIGSNRGLVKTINFSKTDLQYVREARFMRNGIDGLQQLSSVYSVSIEMFGNTLFYPGMDVWLNPYGFGGTALGSPAEGGKVRSLANTLGLGGYHTITGVSTNLTPSGFVTNIRAQHYYSGDGEPIDAANKNNESAEDKMIEEGAISANSQTPKQRDFCDAEIVNIQNLGRDNAAVRAALGETIESSEPEPTNTPQVEQAVPATPEPPGPTQAEADTALGTQSARAASEVVSRSRSSYESFIGDYVTYSDGVVQFEYREGGPDSDDPLKVIILRRA